MSLQTFKDINRVVRTYEIENVAQSFSPKQELTLRIDDEELDRLFHEFLSIIQEFLANGNYLSTARGTLDWLDLDYRYLEMLENMIRIVGEKNYPKYDPDTRSIIEFSVFGMIELIQRVQQYLKKQIGLLRKTHSVSPNLKRSVLFILTELTFSISSIIFTIIQVEAKEAIPQDLYSVVGEGLHRVKHL
jgi:hypothetical protein